MATPSTALSAPNQKRMTEDEYKLSFDCFKIDHGKAYASPLEEERRFQVEVTAKADLSVDEFKDYADNPATVSTGAATADYHPRYWPTVNADGEVEKEPAVELGKRPKRIWSWHSEAEKKRIRVENSALCWPPHSDTAAEMYNYDEPHEESPPDWGE